MPGPEDEWTRMVRDSVPAVRPPRVVATVDPNTMLLDPDYVMLEPEPMEDGIDVRRSYRATGPPPPPMDELLTTIEELKAGRLPQNDLERLIAATIASNAARDETERLEEENRPSRFDRLDDD